MNDKINMILQEIAAIQYVLQSIIQELEEMKAIEDDGK